MLKVANSVINASQITGVLPVANGGTGVTTSTGTGNTVLSASPTFTGTAAFGGISGTGYSFSGSAPSNSLALDSSGNLGIGTNSIPAGFKLYASGGSMLLDNNTVFRQKDSAGNNTLIFALSSSNNLEFGSGSHSGGLSITTGNSNITFTANSGERMRIASTGIVTMSAYGAGTATFSAAGVISSVSDETWKVKDGIPTNPDAMLKKLKPGYWYYNDEKKETFGTDRQLGFYAQNVNAAIGPEAAPTPETITTKNKDGSETTVTKPWGYYDRSVLAVTVMSLQKALATIESLTARITALENK